MIVFVFGLPGSGKSYFASRLSKKIDADYINSDRVRKELFDERMYSDKEKKAVYDKMLQITKEAEHKGTNLVLDATFYKSETRKRFLNELWGLDDIFFIEIQAEENIIKERLKKNRPFSEADFKVYKAIRQKWEPLNEPHLVLQSTDDNIDSMLQEAEEYLQAKNDKRTDW